MSVGLPHAAVRRIVCRGAGNPGHFFVTDAVQTLPPDSHVAFKDVSFSYLGKKNNVEHISFSLPRGGQGGTDKPLFLWIVDAPLPTGGMYSTRQRRAVVYYKADQ